jgi:hypothetical protein
MFISKQEKVSILRRLVVLEEMVKALYKERREKNDVAGWTPEKRAEQSEKLKQSWVKRKAAKAAT